MQKDISELHTFVICAYKESPYLEKCIQSLKKQEYKSRILLTTGTPNDYISGIAEKYGIEMYVNEEESGIANDWNFGLQSAKTELITLAHQDDLYLPGYSRGIVELYEKAKNPILLFTDYCELRGSRKVLKNKLLRIKRLMLFPLRFSPFWNSRFVRRRILSFGSAICCPAVTMVKSKIPIPLFQDNMKSNIDWQAWEELSRRKGAFAYAPEPLMMHRIHQESTTSGLLENNMRKQEDLLVFRKFWPKPIALLIEKLYQSSEKSNRL